MVQQCSHSGFSATVLHFVPQTVCCLHFWEKPEVQKIFLEIQSLGTGIVGECDGL